MAQLTLVDSSIAVSPPVGEKGAQPDIQGSIKLDVNVTAPPGTKTTLQTTGPISTSKIGRSMAPGMYS